MSDIVFIKNEEDYSNRLPGIGENHLCGEAERKNATSVVLPGRHLAQTRQNAYLKRRI